MGRHLPGRFAAATTHLRTLTAPELLARTVHSFRLYVLTWIGPAANCRLLARYREKQTLLTGLAKYLSALLLEGAGA